MLETQAKDEAQQHNNEHEHSMLTSSSSDKRDPYAFGLGKRANEYSFGLGRKRDPYAFGLGKRADNYAFGTNKEIPTCICRFYAYIKGTITYI